MKLLRRDTTPSNDDLPSYAQSTKLISTTSTTYLDNNETQIYIPKERRCLNLSTKEDRQPRNNFRWSSSQVTKQYGAYTASPAKKTTSTIMKVKIDKSRQFQVNWLNISRDTSIKGRTKNSSQFLIFSFLP